MNFPATLELSIGDVRMPFSDEVKYSILGISVCLFLVAIIILVWQLYRYCLQKPTTQEMLNGLLCTEDKSTKKGMFNSDIQRPRFKVERQHEEARRLSRCLSSRSSQLEQGSLEPDGLAEQYPPEEPVQGSLRFSLLYDELQSRLVVTVLEARGLPRRGFSQSVDPFVRVRVLRVGPEDDPPSATPPLRRVLREWQSRLVKDSTNPTFGDQFSCALAEDDVPHITVRLEVRDFDKYSRHGILGEVRAPLGGLNISYPLEILEDLRAPKKDPVGEVLLSLKYLPTSQRLEAGILKVRTLSQSTSKHKALYARISVVCNQCKLRHQKTTVKTRWEVTVFNEVMTFMLPDPHIIECSIVVSVYEVGSSKKSPKHLIGQVTLGKDKRSEDEHWILMMRSLRQPIAKWHLLFV
ncbi:hypothetical protein MATL_G00099300 [Megalops atlanticus]|uniref:C2 domain-containing protein n=1 Tax=Megalops atlanticus TaxID=7932 RepID=A0A9D3Q2K6_MEGAT|nr:hypothetical protein MATL_G00099300 [Megalops atlanticus]